MIFIFDIVSPTVLLSALHMLWCASGYGTPAARGLYRLFLSLLTTIWSLEPIQRTEEQAHLVYMRQEHQPHDACVRDRVGRRVDPAGVHLWGLQQHRGSRVARR